MSATGEKAIDSFLLLEYILMSCVHTNKSSWTKNVSFVQKITIFLPEHKKID